MRDRLASSQNHSSHFGNTYLLKYVTVAYMDNNMVSLADRLELRLLWCVKELAQFDFDIMYKGERPK
jgi:hypothetical protein